MNTSTITRTLAGLGIIAFGVLALLGELNVINFESLFSNWWPVAVIFGGILAFLSNPKQFTWPLLIIFAGILMQLKELEVISFNIWELFWPAVIIATGVSVLLNHLKAPQQKNDARNDDITVVFGGNELQNHTQDYRGGKITAIFGGVTLDLRKASIKNEATITVFALCGGIELKIPEGWVVKQRVTPILGGVDTKIDKTSEKNAPTLYITGDVIMGGVDIKH